MYDAIGVMKPLQHTSASGRGILTIGILWTLTILREAKIKDVTMPYGVFSHVDAQFISGSVNLG